MFESSKFNQDISNWNVNNVQNMIFMFSSAEFNQDISNWNINKECNTMRMFYHSSINNEYKPKGVLISESFNFDSVDKQKKIINAYDILLPDIFKKLNKRETLTWEDYDILT